MTGALPGADVRGFYQALGIELPGGAQHEAPVRCFADPDAHARGTATRPARPGRSILATRGAGQGLASQSAPTARPSLAMDERQLREASARLARLLWPPRVLRDEHRRVWSRATLLELGCGWERGPC